MNADIIPTRPNMSKYAGRVIHNSGRYVASITRPGLIIQSHHTGTGKLLPVWHSQFNEYADAIENAIDSREADALCKSLM